MECTHQINPTQTGTVRKVRQDGVKEAGRLAESDAEHRAKKEVQHLHDEFISIISDRLDTKLEQVNKKE